MCSSDLLDLKTHSRNPRQAPMLLSLALGGSDGSRAALVLATVALGSFIAVRERVPVGARVCSGGAGGSPLYSAWPDRCAGLDEVRLDRAAAAAFPSVLFPAPGGPSTSVIFPGWYTPVMPLRTCTSGPAPPH